MKTNCEYCAGAGCKMCKDQITPSVFIPVEPTGAVRTTKNMAGKTAAGQKYADYKAQVGYLVRSRIKGRIGRNIPISFPEITFFMSMPKNGQVSITNDDKSRGKLKVEEFDAHMKKPDIDNLLKGFFDALNGVLFVDDNQIFEIGKVKKIYSESPGIQFSIETVEKK
jgi:Holliday junction resolvase RusA-like endonuclease